ncbi:hypothetical protein FUSO4_05425 [Fusobacterium necrophorum DJ-1]|uniref:hypothetical protein n=1 Tax=Fusobacterium necrophorum TaxID=859 RepID=UPI0004A98E9A|nr:hypothetical protein [Fusobacterium necrophorum]KDE66060.1 hypothetical protein FUSO4_05425 [Fusobacterium necrophorum DJ-1]
MVQKQYITKRQKGKRSIEERAESINVHEETIKEEEEWMNTYPRKLWNGKSSKEMHVEEFTKYLS